jgi:prevent-host-death family protein
MTAISATKARENLYQLISDVNTNNSAITITNNRGKNAVILSEDDWNAVQETLYLMSVPGLTESIMEGGKEAIDDCLSEDEVEW